MAVYVVEVLHCCGHREGHSEHLPPTGAREYISHRKDELRAAKCSACAAQRVRRVRRNR